MESGLADTEAGLPDPRAHRRDSLAGTPGPPTRRPPTQRHAVPIRRQGGPMNWKGVGSSRTGKNPGETSSTIRLDSTTRVRHSFDPFGVHLIPW